MDARVVVLIQVNAFEIVLSRLTQSRSAPLIHSLAKEWLVNNVHNVARFLRSTDTCSSNCSSCCSYFANGCTCTPCMSNSLVFGPRRDYKLADS